MNRAEVRIAIACIAAGQHNVISRSQVLACGGNDDYIRHRLRSGEWQAVHPGVYLVAGSEKTFESEIWAAFLAVGTHSTITHELSLHLSGMKRVPRKPLTFTIHHGGHARISGTVVHQIDDLRPGDVITSPIGIPMSNVPRALVECAETLRPKHLAELVDDAVIEDRLTTYVRISAALERVARPGKPGVPVMAAILDERIDGQPPHGSRSEKRFFDGLRARGMPLPRRQALLPGRKTTEGIVDSMYDFERVIIEIDSRRWHARERARKVDAARDMQARRAGYEPIRVGYERVADDMDDVCVELADVLSQRRALFIAAGRTPPRALAEIPSLSRQ